MKYLFILLLMFSTACVEDSKSEAIQIATEARQALEDEDCFFFEGGLIQVQLHGACLDIICEADNSQCGGDS